MSFFNILKRLVVGEPPFPEQPDLSQPAKPVGPNIQVSDYGTPRNDKGLKIMPEVVLERLECRNEDGHMECRCIINNHSDQPIELYKLVILSTTRMLDNYFLRPKEEKEFVLYQGPFVASDSDTNCELYYKNDTDDDYFNARHLVDFMLNTDGTTYLLHSIRFVPPVQDVYE